MASDPKDGRRARAIAATAALRLRRAAALRAALAEADGQERTKALVDVMRLHAEIASPRKEEG